MAERGRRKSWLDRCFFVVRHCRRNNYSIQRSELNQFTFSLNSEMSPSKTNWLVYSLSVNPIKLAYAATLNAVKNTTAFPLVLNLRL